MRFRDFLLWLITGGRHTPPPAPAPAPDPHGPGADRTAMVALLNTVRASVGVAPLGDESRLDAAADAHAADMATHHFLGHYGSDGLNEDGRVRAAGYNFQMVAECVAKGQRDTRSVFLAWINDKSHRDIILNPGLTQVGLGTHTWGIGAIPYWCLVLASPKEGS